MRFAIIDHCVTANIRAKTVQEEVEDGKINYINTLEYNANPRDIAQMLKCEVIHKGYNRKQLEDGANLAEAQLNLRFRQSSLNKSNAQMRTNFEIF